MPTITNIEPQKKDKKRFNLYADGKFYCGLYDDTIMKFGLRNNDTITAKQLKQIKVYDEFIFAKQISLNYLSYRLRSADEVRGKMLSKKISQHTINKTIKHLQGLGLLNDEEFAQQLVYSKINNMPVGRKVLQQKLYEKGINKEISDKVLSKVFSEVDERELAEKQFRKYYPKVKSETITKQKRKIYEYLSRKGFNYDTIIQIINEYL